MRPRPPNPRNLKPEQAAALRARLLEACDRLSDEQILDLADALHDAIRLRHRLRLRMRSLHDGVRAETDPEAS